MILAANNWPLGFLFLVVASLAILLAGVLYERRLNARGDSTIYENKP